MSDAQNIAPELDERIKSRSRFREAMIRPELGGIVGTIVLALFLPLVSMIESVSGG